MKPDRFIPPGLLDQHVEAAFPGVYFNPARWNTADGYIPFPVFDLYALALWPIPAMDRLNTAHAIGLAFADPKAGARLHERTLTEAYPGGA